MRALWDQRFEFRDLLPRLARPIFTFVTHLVRQWDYQAAQRVDCFVANSKYVADRINQYYRRECDVIYPPVVLQTDEDFGIVPVEAQGYGRPVIAFGHGGSLETIIGDGQRDAQGTPLSPTGIFFAEQTVDSLCDAILRFEAMENCFEPAAIRRWAEGFADHQFERQFLKRVEKVASKASFTG